MKTNFVCQYELKKEIKRTKEKSMLFLTMTQKRIKKDTKKWKEQWRVSGKETRDTETWENY